MSHTSEKRWRDTDIGNATILEGISTLASNIARELTKTLISVEEGYQELLEIYAYAGGTDQSLADQLFKEDWEARSVPGVHAVITVDVISPGQISNPTITEAGTAYTDGVGFILNIGSTAGGGDGTAELTYDVVSGLLTNVLVNVAGDTYNLGTSILVLGVPAAGPIFETEANAEELAKATDIRAAMLAAHEIYQCGNNVLIGQDDRLAKLRRMS